MNHSTQFRKNPAIGLFANLARHNIFLVMNDIIKKVVHHSHRSLPPELLEPLKKEELLSGKDYQPPIVLKILKMNGYEVDKLYISKLLQNHFPFLKFLGNYKNLGPLKLDDYYAVFELLFTHLEHIRNYYSHAYHSPINYDLNLFELINGLMDAAIPEVGLRYGRDKNELNFLKRQKKIVSDPSFRKKRSHKNQQAAVIKSWVANDSKFSVSHRNELTNAGITYLISIFLQKGQVYQFLQNFEKFNQDPVKELYSIFSLRMPYYTIEIEDKLSEQALFLDLLNEFRFCSKQLYDHLTPEEQKLFHLPLITNEEDTPSPDENSISEPTNGSFITVTRKTNRFAYFAMRIIEHLNLYKKLDFHIDLGKMVYHKYEKQLSGIGMTTRTWEKELRVYGKLHEIAKKLPDFLKDIQQDPSAIDAETKAPYWLDTFPHYHFDGMNISLKLRQQNKGELIPFKQTLRSDQTISIPKLEEPDFVMNTRELQASLFYDYLAKKYAWDKRAEDIIITFKEKVDCLLGDIIMGNDLKSEFYHFFQNQKNNFNNHHATINVPSNDSSTIRNIIFKRWLKSKYQLDPGTIPNTIEKWIIDATDTETQLRVESALQKMIAETDTMLHDVAREQDNWNMNKSTGRMKSNLKWTGKMAVFVTRDIMRFIDFSKAGEGPNPELFQHLQALWALQSGPTDKLVNALKSCGVFIYPRQHPFFKETDITSNVEAISLFNIYLTKRKQYLENVLTQFKNGIKKVESLKFFKIRTIPEEADKIKELAINIKGKLTNIPNGLFKYSILNEIAKSNHPDLISLQGKLKVNDEWQIEKSTMSSIINTFFNVIKESKQNFYSFTRNYSTKDNLGQKFELIYDPLKGAEFFRGISQNNIPMEVLQRFRKVINENERAIRHFESCQQVLFLYAKDWLLQMGNTIGLNELEANKISLEHVNPIDGGNFLNSTVEYTINTSGKHIKFSSLLKNSGKGRKVLWDRRLEGLFKYYNDSIKVITNKEILRQLNAYDTLRVEMFSEMLEFEYALQNNTQLKKWIEEQLQGNHYINHKKILKHLKVNEAEKKLILNIRNSICHNQFPNPLIGSMNFSPNESYAKTINDCFKDAYTKVKIAYEGNKT